MSHIGILSVPFYSHLQCLSSIGQELRDRGHRVTVFNIEDVGERTLARGLEFRAVCQASLPLGTLSKLEAGWTDPKRRVGVRSLIGMLRAANAGLFEEAPRAIKEAGVEVLLVDQDCPIGATVADVLDMPYVTVCAAAPAHHENTIPPASSPWPYSTGLWAQLRNQAAFALFELVSRPLLSDLNHWRRKAKLPEYSMFEDSFSRLAQITQLPAAFDFPRMALPPHFHYVGPFLSKPAQPIPFPWERLDGRPLIYASLGTLQNRNSAIFKTIAAACAGLEFQLVISLGGNGNPDDYRDLPGQPVVVAFAPQLELLSRARLTICHAGLNTALESLSNGVPIVAIPFADDQPGMAARLAWQGAGLVVSPAKLSASVLHSAIERVLNEPSFKQETLRLQAAVLTSGGVRQAAAIVEAVLATGRPVASQLAVSRQSQRQ